MALTLSERHRLPTEAEFDALSQTHHPEICALP
jgi:hypothetical protein